MYHGQDRVGESFLGLNFAGHKEGLKGDYPRTRIEGGACLPACLPAYLPACLRACLRVRVLVCLPELAACSNE
jgi:hypothetical protein